MSKDIRSFFTKVNGSSGTKPKIQESPSPKSKKRTRRVIESDDEDDDLITTKKPKEVESSSKSKPKKPEVVVKVENFFGTAPVLQKKQTIAPKKPQETKEKTTPMKEKKSSKKKKEKNAKVVDLEFENDDELEASLLQTDDEKLVTNVLSSEKKKKEERKTEVKESKSEEKKTPKKAQTPQKEDYLNSEKKKQHAEAYQKYLNRAGPKNPGSKEVPKGTPTCLQGLAFVITGVLDSLEREEASDLIKQCGGRVVSQVSKKTDFVVVGEEPGASKMEKAEKFGTKKINEDELLNMIKERSGRDSMEEDVIETTPEKTSKYFKSESAKKRPKVVDEEVSKPKQAKKDTEVKGTKLSPVKQEKVTKVSPVKQEVTKVSPVKQEKVTKVSPVKKEVTKVSPLKVETPSTPQTVQSTETLLWVDKYKPKSTKNIVGQTGDKSNVKKLTKWLQNWHSNHLHKGDKKQKRPAPWAQNDDGSFYKAALLSGPPGVGKTTSVQLVCQELGFEIIEMNASNTRSKRLLQEEVADLLSSKSIRGFLESNKESYMKHVLVMDEVDGMAGNEDRGGIQELIQLIKTTKIPIVGICNDRNHPKMRSLVNYCFDLRFQRPRLEQIKGAMKSVCFRENLDISSEALEELITSSNHDLRQVLHNLSALSHSKHKLSVEEARKKGEDAKKPLNLTPWDVVKKVFTASEREKMSFSEKSDLFFQDYSMIPLFVQEMYLNVQPNKARGNEKEKLNLISKAADSLLLGDVIEKTIRTQNAWSLLPVQAVFSSVMPGHYMSGYCSQRFGFPVWFGKNSKSNKFDRLLQELHSTLRINVTGSKESINLDYINHLRDSIVKPLAEKGSEGVQESLKFMLEYQLTKEDLDSILEVSSWPCSKDFFSKVDSKVKAALTKALNKESQLVCKVKASKAKGSGGDEDEFGMEESEGVVLEEEEEENDDVDLDPMIKKGKPKKVPKEESSSKAKASKKEPTKKGKEKEKKKK